MTDQKSRFDLYQLFSVPFGRQNIGDVSELTNLVKQEKFFETSNKDGFITEETQLLHKDKYRKYLDLIENKLNNFLSSIGVDTENFNFYITGSWGTKHQKGNYAPQHKHKNSLISGCLYLQTDEKSGDINFVNLQNNLFPSTFDVGIKNTNPLNAEVMTFTPNNSDLYFFPSHLQHYVNPSNSSNDRYMIAFNSFVRGHFKEPTSSLKLERSKDYD
jgi:uncharacterized protein (TIGR02466 family)|tara:strand:+ start:835 stop:1482 length:648 start_codon:yes stop_codon:yes gene_type:complete